MRLLTRDSNDRTCIVGPFARDETPRYAILSHTWGPDTHEVKLQDLQDGTAQSKPGWQKIAFCQNQAIADGLAHVWVDTCCIDKTSSAELSEAINSMYRWYRKSARCYVVLEDVTTYDKQKWEDMLLSSRWMTRGWTLQELLAPSSVQFFSKEGRLLGDKDSLAHLLTEATSIPLAALASVSPTRFSRHEMMRWVESRKTKRDEDKAYCMLGLFQVSMPVNYGEGYEDACARLDEAIERKFGHPLGLGQRKQVEDPADLTEADKSYLRSFWFPDMDRRRMEISRPASGTLSWLFEHDYYRLWKESYAKGTKDNLLWIKGHPGVGKSVLMKEAARRVSTIETDGCIVVAHFFNSKAHGLENNTTGLFRSFLFQLLQYNRTCLRKLSKAYANVALLRNTPGHAPNYVWTQDELREMLALVISDMSDRCITIFVDALDEGNTIALRKEADYWRELAEDSRTLRICISCRRFPQLPEGLYHVLYVENYNPQDIQKYVRKRLGPYISTKDRNWVLFEQGIITKARGVFLWVVLVLDQLLEDHDNGLGDTYLLSRLAMVPRTLASLLDNILAHIHGISPAKRLPVLHWAVLARTTLRVDEWHHIMAITQSPHCTSLSMWRSSDDHIARDNQLERRLRVISRGLIEVTTSVQDETPDTDSSKAWAGSLDLTRGGSRVVQVIHGSVHDHLISDQNALNATQTQRPFRLIGHSQILKDCLHYLEFSEFDEYVEARLRALHSAFVVRQSHASSSLNIAKAEDHDKALAKTRNETNEQPGQPTKQSLRRWNLELETASEAVTPASDGSEDFRGPKRRRLALLPDSTDVPNQEIDRISNELVTPDDMVESWLESLGLATNRGFTPGPRELSTSSSPRVSTASTHCTASTRVLEDHMALLPYITTHFWDHAYLLSDAKYVPEAVIEQFCTRKQWRRWQAIDVSAPFAPDVADIDLQCAYFRQLGLYSWAEHMQRNHNTNAQQNVMQERPSSDSPSYKQAIDKAMEKSVQRRGSVASFSSAGSHGSVSSDWV